MWGFYVKGFYYSFIPNIITEEYEWVFALGTWTQMPSQSPVTAGQQTRSTSRLTDQSTQQQDEQARIISDMHGKTIFLSISSICYTIKGFGLSLTSVFLYGELFFTGAVRIEVYELMELCDMWPVRLFSNPTWDQRDAGPAPEFNHLTRCYFTLKLACTLRILL